MSARRWIAAAALAACAAAHADPAPEAAVPAAETSPAAAGARPALPPRAAPPPLAMPRAVEAVLPDGLRVIVVEHHHRAVLRMFLVLPTGSLADPRGSEGATSLAVELASDYRERRADGEELVGEKSLRKQVEEMGGAVAFEAGPDVSVVSLSGYPRDAAAYLRMLAEAVAEPRCGEESFRARRDQQLDELEDMEPYDPEALWRTLREAAFGPGQPYARATRGTLGSMGRLGLEDVVAQQALVFVPAGASLVVIGDVQADRVVADARAAFRRWTRRAPRPAATAGSGPGAAAVHGVRFLRRQPASTLVVCTARSLEGVGASDAELKVLAAVLGGGARSRLMRTLRQAQGLTYQAEAEVLFHRGARALLACATLAGDRAEEGVQALQEVLESLRTAPPGEDELEAARAQLRAEAEEVTESAAGLGWAWVDALRLGLPAPRLARECADVERVTAADVQRTAQAVLRRDALRWILSGDTIAASRAAVAGGLGLLSPISTGREPPPRRR